MKKTIRVLDEVNAFNKHFSMILRDLTPPHTYSLSIKCTISNSSCDCLLEKNLIKNFLRLFHKYTVKIDTTRGKFWDVPKTNWCLKPLLSPRENSSFTSFKTSLETVLSCSLSYCIDNFLISALNFALGIRNCSTQYCRRNNDKNLLMCAHSTDPVT